MSARGADTVGNMLELSSTAFLMGPRTQLKRMTSPTRFGAAIVYVGAMIATLFESANEKSVNKVQFELTVVASASEALNLLATGDNSFEIISE